MSYIKKTSQIWQGFKVFKDEPRHWQQEPTVPHSIGAQELTLTIHSV